MSETIACKESILDKLALLLDKGIFPGNQEAPIIQYWKHLADKLDVPEEVKLQCQNALDNSPSNNMFNSLKASQPDFEIASLKDHLKAEEIKRNDLVHKIEKCDLPGRYW